MTEPKKVNYSGQKKSPNPTRPTSRLDLIFKAQDSRRSCSVKNLISGADFLIKNLNLSVSLGTLKTVKRLYIQFKEGQKKEERRKWNLNVGKKNPSDLGAPVGPISDNLSWHAPNLLFYFIFLKNQIYNFFIF